MGFQLFATNGNETTEISALARRITWSGDYKTVSRQLSFSLLRTDRDARQPQVSCETGSVVDFDVDGERVFSGLVLDHSVDTAGTDADNVAYDWGLYLRKNETYRKVENATPEAVVRALADECGFRCGSIAETGIPVSQNFLPGDYYTIIKTVYELASAKTGVKYQLRFRGQSMDVVEKVLSRESLLLSPGANLLSVKSRDVGTGLINRVRIYSTDGTLQDTVEDTDSQALYGVFQRTISASGNDDPAAQARQLLTDNGLQTTLTCECLGSLRLLTGNTVVVEEPVTRTYGLFHILSDAHTWDHGIWWTKIQISLKDLISEAEAKTAASA